MKEIVEKRQENSKTFDLGRGKRQLVTHIGDIHYKDNYSDDKEQWKDIDLTIRDGRLTTAPYELTIDGQKLTLKDKKTGEVSTIELLEASPSGLNWEVVPEFTRVCFSHTVSKAPFEAKFRVTGKIPFRTRASDDEGELELETSLVDGILTEKLSVAKDKETGQVRPIVGNIRIDPTWQVGASTDDCFRSLGTTPQWSLLVINLEVGYYSAGYSKKGCGMRFTNITIPQSSTIDTAYLTLRCTEGLGATVNSRISAEDIDDAPTFADSAATFDTRFGTHTTARIDWDNIPNWTAGVWYDSPDISTVIKEIVDRVGWASGQDMVIFWEDFDGRSSDVRNVSSYDDDSADAPKLVITYTPAVTEKTSSETGSGVDAKASGNPLAIFARSETGGGVDGHKAVAPQSVGESGSGVDAKKTGNPLATYARSETGSGAEGLPARGLFALQTGSGIEHILDRALVLISESGSGVDTVLSLLGKLVSESGTGVENSYLHILEGVKDSSDSGVGAEASSLAALFQRDEVGQGAEVVAARALFSREPQMGAIDLARVLTAAITGAETGTGAEASLVAYYQKKDDSGVGVDASTLVALFTGEDAGAGAEAITLLAAMVSHDTGVAVEAVIDFFRKLIDSGEGEENLHLIGRVGRAMKLITYLRAYSDLRVYTKPYSDLKSYTSEVEQ